MYTSKSSTSLLPAVLLLSVLLRLCLRKRVDDEVQAPLIVFAEEEIRIDFNSVIGNECVKGQPTSRQS